MLSYWVYDVMLRPVVYDVCVYCFSIVGFSAILTSFSICMRFDALMACLLFWCRASQSVWLQQSRWLQLIGRASQFLLYTVNYYEFGALRIVPLLLLVFLGLGYLLVMLMSYSLMDSTVLQQLEKLLEDVIESYRLVSEKRNELSARVASICEKQVELQVFINALYARYEGPDGC
ncbi:hypothetical protein Hanom_Chr10g00912931 [Helianthus anomalus]